MNDATDTILDNVSGNQHSGGSSYDPNSAQSKKSISQDINDSYNPFFSQCTQDENESSVDVMWDWYSPQSKPQVRKYKRSDRHQSPKLPIKRQSSNSQINGFNKLREELKTLRDHIVESTDTGDMCTAKHTDIKCNINAKDLEDLEDLEDAFNDSMDEQLLVCSQEVEYTCISGKPVSKDQFLKCLDKPLHYQEHIEKTPYSKTSTIQIINHNNEVDAIFNTCNCSIQNNTTYNVISNSLKDNMNKIADDSFDFILETLKDEDLEVKPFIAADGIARQTSCNNIQNTEQFTDSSFQFIVQEIEQKRKKALSTLELKKKQIAYEVTPNCTAQEAEQKRKEASKFQVKQKEVSYESESPIKCSPEEIEQKRLQAVAKLETKKKQDIIERNRQQALKRLEESRRKRALQTQTSFPRKLYNPNI